mmetsp:Transcript_30656/g.89542  ORF Transcript_30656/g.89542 Transcript_30656/m.89542 type:complete len:210 (-) Transcript_30656:10-639(-)
MYIICLDVGEAVSGDDGLGGDTTDSDHGQTAVEELGNLLLLHTGIVLGGKLGAEGEVTGFALSLEGGNNGGGGNKDVDEANPEEELVHGARLEEGVVGIDGPGDGLEGVHVAGDADEVGGDEAHDGEHGGAAVLELGLTEPGEERLVGLGQVERIVLELLAAEVDASVHLVPDGIGGDGGRADTGLGSGGECGGRAGEGEGKAGGSLHL